jgi:23S rRNA pseudouridine1911/1915/1917 synthase
MTTPVQFLINEGDAGSRVDQFCALRFGNLSRMRIANLLEAGGCRVNGSAARAGYRLAAGDLVEVAFEDGPPTAMTPEPIPLDIAYEDDQIVVVVKPAGMLVHPTRSVKTGTLANALAYHLNRTKLEDRGSRIKSPADCPVDPQSAILNPRPAVRPGLVHRLDRATSGLMVIAKMPRSLATLSRHFRKRLVEKRYVGLIWGEVEQDHGTITAPIGRDPDGQPQWQVMENGKTAETRFKVMERLPGATLLELEPVTGRTNQLRIHCAHMGHPIIGDRLYCESHYPHCGVRLCLHAWKLAFHHPVTGEWMEFCSAIPHDIRAFFEGLRA